MKLQRAMAAGAAVSLPVLAMALPANAQENATVSVLHGIPTGSGADVVDVYAGDTLLIDNFTPGTLETLEVPAGTYDLAVYADGTTPDSGDPVLEAPGTAVPAGANATVTANLSEAGDPALNVFVNDVSSIAAGEGRLTVRHIAAAPAVDVRANGAVAFAGLTNPNEASADLPAGTISADVVAAGSETVVLGPADVNVKEGANTIVYAWGSLEGESLDLAVQVVEGAMHSAPSGVPAGDGSLAGSTGNPALALGIGAAVLLGAAVATRRVATSKS
jgi:hypothetical protein